MLTSNLIMQAVLLGLSVLLLIMLVIRSFFKKKEEIIIKDIDSFRLCEYKDGSRLSVYVSAAISDGCLLISGQDLGDCVREDFGDSDYEYWYSFDVENTKLLITRLLEQTPKLDTKELLSVNFSGLEGCSNLRNFCEKFGIKYDFSTYV